MAPSLAQAIATGATLLTPSQRAARAIRRAHDTQMSSSGSAFWTPANVLPIESFLAAEWHRRLLAGTEFRTLLNPAQLHTLWREIVAADPEARTRSADSLAEMAARAWALLHLYEGRDRLREFPLSTDSRAFERWFRAFERRLTRAHFLTPAELPSALGTIETDLVLVDFDTLPPALESLFPEAQHLRTKVPCNASLFAAEDDTSELRTAAHWILTQQKANPQARIAIVVPNLADRRASIDRIFAPILAPESLPITAPAQSPAYEFSLGQPLASLPLAIAALDLLTWPLQPLPLERISSLLLSPWFGTASPAAAEFDAFDLRQSSLLRPELTLEATIRLVQNSTRAARLDDLHHRLRSLNKAAREAQLVSSTHTFGDWSDTLRTLLEAAGWTAQSRTTSLAFQQHRRFDSALDELATLGFEDRQVDAQQALAALTRILREAIFAPESTDAPVQILGPLEIGGAPFDALWFLGADDLTWPPSLSANPLLPWQLQRALLMPGADRARDVRAAKFLTGRIAHSAAEVVFSYARRAEEGERRASPLLAALDLQPLAAPNLTPALAPQSFLAILDETILSPLPTHEVRGGTQILKLQAACAFRAFAERRLWSTAPDAREPGLDARERGNIVHRVMQSFWIEIKTQQALRSLPASARRLALDRAIVHVFAELRLKPETPWDEAYLAIQHDRLHALLSPWLDLEAARPPFEVQASEEEKHLQLGPLTLKMRIDRIDSTRAGDLILDYKTGDANPASWKSDRPDEPQLPLYAILAQAEGRPLAGVAFALLRAGDGLGLKGYTEDASLFKPTAMEAPSLAEQVAQWRGVLTNLAIDFASGRSSVDPKLYPKTCTHCGQRILCRLDPDKLAAAQLEEEETPDV